MSIREYQRQVIEWEKKYGKKKTYFASFIDVKCACVKCGKIKSKMSRHHKGSEFFFACIRPDDYAPRYIEFNLDDVVRLCDNCHKNIERFYEPLKIAMWEDIYIVGGVSNVTKEWCDNWINKFKSRYEVWIKRAPRKRKRKRKSHSAAKRGKEK